MDKAFKRVNFRQAGLPLLPREVVFNYQWQGDPAGITRQLEESLGYHKLFTPANLGSSVGVTTVTTRRQLAPALELALSFDRKAVIEKGQEGAREIECSVLGHR